MYLINRAFARSDSYYHSRPTLVQKCDAILSCSSGNKVTLGRTEGQIESDCDAILSCSSGNKVTLGRTEGQIESDQGYDKRNPSCILYGIKTRYFGSGSNLTVARHPHPAEIDNASQVKITYLCRNKTMLMFN